MLQHLQTVVITVLKKDNSFQIKFNFPGVIFPFTPLTYQSTILHPHELVKTWQTTKISPHEFKWFHGKQDEFSECIIPLIKRFDLTKFTTKSTTSVYPYNIFLSNLLLNGCEQSFLPNAYRLNILQLDHWFMYDIACTCTDDLSKNKAATQSKTHTPPGSSVYQYNNK